MPFLSRFAAALVCGGALCSPTYAANGPRVAVSPRERIAGEIDDAQRTTIPHSHSSRIAGLTETGRVGGDTRLTGLTLVLKSSDEQEHALAGLLDRQQDKAHPNYRRWMTPEEFGASFGVHPGDLARIAGWLGGYGLSVDKVARGARIVKFSGTAGQVEKAFHTEMHAYLAGGESRIANSTDISIPAALTPVVRGIARLNNFRSHTPPAQPQMGMRDANGGLHPLPANAAAPLLTNPANPGSGAAGAHYVGPGDYAAIYDTAPLLNQGINGAGVSIGLVEDSDILLSDVALYRSVFGLPVNQPAVVHVGSDSGSIAYDDVSSDADVTGAIDAEVAGALAPMASVYYVTTGTSPFDFSAVDDSAVYLVDNNATDIVCMNFSEDETDSAVDYLNGNGAVYPPTYIDGDVQFFQTLWEQAAAQGQSVFVTSGIGGPDAYDIYQGVYYAKTPAGTGVYSVNGYASTGFNVAVGSTEFNEGAATYASAGVTPFWGAASSAPPYTSALGYIPENAWNQSTDGTVNGGAVAGASSIYASGGGVSAYNPIPNWQINPAINPTADPQPPTGFGAYPAGYLATTPSPHRLLPDVAMASGTLHDGTIVCYEGNCTLTAAGLLNTFGLVNGATASTASMAGIQALIDQANGGRQGNPNYYYYTIAAAQSSTACNATTYPSIGTAATASCGFHDIVAGNTDIAANAKNTSQIGWNAGTGFDLATGLGSPDAANLAALWSTVRFSPTTVGLNLYDETSGGTQVSPIVIAHGDELYVGIEVYPVDGAGVPIAGTPTGDVALIAQNTGPGGIGFYNITPNGTGCANYAGPSVPITAAALTSTAGSASTGYVYTIAFTGNVPLGQKDEIADGRSVYLTGLTGSYTFLNDSYQFVAASTATTFVIEYGSVTALNIAGSTTGTATPASPAIGDPNPAPVPCGGTAGDGNPYDALNGGALLQSGGFPALPGGTYNVYAHYTGDGTYAASNSQPVPVVVSPELTRLALGVYSLTTANAVAGPPVTQFTYGQNVYLDARVIGTSQYGTPTGTATFTLNNGTANLPVLVDALDTTGDAFLLAGVGAANSTYLDEPPNYEILPVGAYSASAVYSGDASFAPSTSATSSFVVTPAVSRVAVTAETADIKSGAAASLVATVASAATALYPGYPSTLPANGTMAFTDTTTGTALGSSPVVNGATAFSVPAGLIVAPGAHSIAATFTDTDGNYTSGAVSAKAATITVVAGTATSVALTAPAAIQVGAPTSLAATVTPSAATGTVVYYANGVEIGTATLASGKATLALATLSAGTYTISAVYGGSSTYDASATAASVAQTVAPNTPGVILSAAPTGDSGSGYSMQAQLKTSPNNLGAATLPAPAPNPVFNFYQGKALLGSANATIDPTTLNFVANLTTTSVLPGPSAITATFAGDANYATASASETVYLGQTSLALAVASPALSASSPILGTGEPITLQAVVTPYGYTTATSFCAPATTTPALTYPATCGRVSFYDNGILLGTAETLPPAAAVPATAANPATQTGVATLTATLPTSAASHVITAFYAGDAHFYASSTGTVGGTGLGYAIDTATPGFTIAANPAALTVGAGGAGSVAITATVSGNWAGQAPLVCTGLPANATCTFRYNPNNPPAAGTPLSYFSLNGVDGSGYTGTLTIALSTASSSAAFKAVPLWLPALSLPALLGVRRRRINPRIRRLLTAALLLSVSLAGTACSSGDGTTPKGTYTVTITANGVGSTPASPSTQPSATLALTVN